MAFRSARSRFISLNNSSSAFDKSIDAGWLHDKAPVAAQVAATLAVFTLNELQPADYSSGGARHEPSATHVGERAGVAD